MDEGFVDVIRDYLSQFGLLLQNTLDWTDNTTVFISHSLESQGVQDIATRKHGAW